jgi:GTP cyclohydrolase FolE2
MRILQSLIPCATALVVSMSISYAGPCSQEIARLRADIDAKQRANAAAGSTAPSTEATTHRQPTQWSIGAAESQLSEVPPEKLGAVRVRPTAPATKPPVGRL